MTDFDDRFFEYVGSARYKGSVYEINVSVPGSVHWENDIKTSVKSAGGIDVTLSSNSEVDAKLFKSLYENLNLPDWVKYIVSFVPSSLLTKDANQRKTETFYVREDNGKFQAFTIEQINAMNKKMMYVFRGNDSKRRLTIFSPENSEEKVRKALKTLGIQFNGKLLFEKASAGDGKTYEVFEFIRANNHLRKLYLDKDKVLLSSGDNAVISKLKNGELQKRDGAFKISPQKAKKDGSGKLFG